MLVQPIGFVEQNLIWQEFYAGTETQAAFRGMNSVGCSTALTDLVVGLPQTLVVAPDGALVWRSFGAISYESFTAELRRLMSSDRS